MCIEKGMKMEIRMVANMMYLCKESYTVMHLSSQTITSKTKAKHIAMR